jgi:tRNA pseudouridine38-40 synthase
MLENSKNVPTRFFLQLSYKGTNYNGWQVQLNTSKTIQEIISQSLETLLSEKIELVGCGRTDTGVHASDYYAHFDAQNSNAILEQNIVYKLNKLLPKDIAIKQLWEVNANAHARFDATSRSYRYFIHQQKNPFLIDTSFYFNQKLNMEAMNQACQYLFEHTDFSAFSKSNTQTKTNNCNIYKAQWSFNENGLMFEIEASRFLRNMVRAIVGTMIEIGVGKIKPQHIIEIIESRDRKQAGFSVPACGLFLCKINYPEWVMNYSNGVTDSNG